MNVELVRIGKEAVRANKFLEVTNVYVKDVRKFKKTSMCFSWTRIRESNFMRYPGFSSFFVLLLT